MNISYENKYLKYKHKYLNLKNQYTQQGGSIYFIDLINSPSFDIKQLANGDILEVKYGVDSDTIIFNVTNESEDIILKYTHSTPSDPNLDIVLLKPNNLLVSKLRYIRAIKDNLINFKTLFIIYVCLSKKLGAVKLVLTDNAVFYKDKKLKINGYSALGFRVFNRQNSIYMTNQSLGFEPDFSLFGSKKEKTLSLHGEACYDNDVYSSDLVFLSNVKFETLIPHYTHWFEKSYNDPIYGFILFQEDSVNDTLKTMNFGNYLDHVIKEDRPNNYEYVRTLLNLLSRDPQQTISDEAKEILKRYKRYELATTNLISRDFTCS